MGQPASEAAGQRLVMQGVWKSFGNNAVLRDVELAAGAGEIVGLLGSNGAGKSTLVKILSGAYSADRGDIIVDGTAVHIDGPRSAIAHGIGLLPQELSVHNDMTVAENIFLGDLPMRRRFGLPVVDRADMATRSTQTLRQLGFDHIDPGREMASLSVPEKRVVEIARAVAGNARILIMDEPTAALTDQEAKSLFQVLRRLSDGGVTVIYISHYLDEVFEICDRIEVLRDGVNAGSFDTDTSNHDAVLAAMLGGAIEQLYPEHGGSTGDPLLSVEGLSVGGLLTDIDFSVAKGEIFGVFGLVGSGVESLGRAIYGAMGPLDRGSLTIVGKPYAPRTPRTAKAAGIAFVAAERKQEGIVADLTVRENLTLPFLDRFGEALRVDVGAEKSHADHWIKALGIRARGTEQRIRFLSGGNQQKVCIARWLVDGMSLLILEEPTRGVDVGARKEIYRELRTLADQGLGILVLSSDVEEIAGIADRSVVLDRGRIVGRADQPKEAEALMALAFQDQPSTDGRQEAAP
ncbi:MAG: sugar ABC transporter ATP-binding protein [Pseudomonadota bacterium]